MSENRGLPRGWVWATLEECCTRITDGTHLPPQFAEEGIPFLFVRHIVKGQITFAETKFISESTYRELNHRCPVEKGDILYSAVGSYGVAVPVLTDRPFSFQRHIAHIKPNGSVLQKYLSYGLNSPECKAQAHRVARGIAQKTVTLTDLRRFRMPVAPLPEQRRIVAKIEELFSDLDAGVVALERARVNLKRYRSAMLKSAVEGRLTKKWRQANPPVESASKLLDRILTERHKKWERNQLTKYAAAGKQPPKNWREKYQEPVAPNAANLFELPAGWCWATVDQVCEFLRYGSSSKASNEESVPVLRMGNIQDGEISLESLKYLPSDHHEFPELLLNPGDLLFNRTNSAELVGKAAVYKGSPNPCSYASYLIAARFLNGCDSRIVCYFLNSIWGRKWVASVVSQQVGQANVNGSKLRALVIPLPPESEQSKIIAATEQRLSVASELEGHLDVDLQRAVRVRQSILRFAFSGRLVPQDPNDAPAAALPDGTTAEQTADAVRKKQTKKSNRPLAYFKTVLFDV